MSWLGYVGRVSCLVVAWTSWNGRVAAADEMPTVAAIKAAVAKSLPLLEKGARGSLEQRKQCFTCHNQGLPILALTTAQPRGFEIDADHLRQQLEFTANFLAKNKDRYREGKGQGGQVDTAGYSLWSLDNGRWPADETTAAVVEYFLLYQKELDHWQPQSKRPPSEQSPFTSTYLAARALKKFGTPEQQERINQRCEQVRTWLCKTDPKETEDCVFRLRALSLLDAAEKDIRGAAEALIAFQRADGGWSQLPDTESDAYATGSALVALHDVGLMKTNDPKYQQGIAYLIRTQLEDGSWHVKSRSKPFQTYFESGYPHGKDQFISIAAAGWSTTALALALPMTPVNSPEKTEVKQPSSESGE